GQGSLEYLLLIAGAILVAATILLLLILTYVPAAGNILQNNLSDFPQGNFGGGGGGGGTGFGSLVVDWSTMPSLNPVQFQRANSVGGFTITNPHPTQDVKFDAVRIHFDLVDFAFTDDDFRVEKLTLGGQVVDFSSTPADSGDIISFSPITIPSNGSIKGTIGFNTDVVSKLGQTVNLKLYAYCRNFQCNPTHRHQTMYIEFLYTQTNPNTPIARSGTLHTLLLTEQNASVCGFGTTSNAVTFSTVTDAYNDDGSNSGYLFDYGYSTRFDFDRIPPNATLFEVDFLIQQTSPVVTQNRQGTNSDPIYFIKDPPSAPITICTTIDEIQELPLSDPLNTQLSGKTYVNITPASLNPGLELFHLASGPSFVLPGENALNFTMVGEDFDPNNSLSSSGEAGNRVWYSYSSGAQPPVLIIRHQTP
ncbi:MAG: hypothetical protein U1C71_02365, partial [archaeon]|nr:hypothetical protein [archaeon]